MIELSDDFDIPARDNGTATVREYFIGIVGIADRHILAKNIVEGKTPEELVEYIAQMLLGIDCIKQNIVNSHLFGSKSQHV